MLAVSANSPFVDGLDSGLHSARTETFTRTFPRCGVPDAYGSWATYRDYVDFLIQTNSIVEYTQVWWSVRPHFAFGTVEVRICDAQSTASESEALAALLVACIAQAARDIDEGVPFEDPPMRMIEENMWRAIRFGLDGKHVDFEARTELPTVEAAERLLAWTAPMCGELGLDIALPARNGAQRQRAATAAGASPQEVYAESVRETRATYAPAPERT
jgi:carboxylate-amine ligase